MIWDDPKVQGWVVATLLDYIRETAWDHKNRAVRENVQKIFKRYVDRVGGEIL